MRTKQETIDFCQNRIKAARCRCEPVKPLWKKKLFEKLDAMYAQAFQDVIDFLEDKNEDETGTD